MIAAIFLIILGIYLGCGILFAVPFVVFGVKQIDPHAAHGSWGFRVLIFPGTMAFWPLLLQRWMKGIHEPPEECNAHRIAADDSCRRRREESHSKTETSQSLVTSSSTKTI